MKPNKDWRDELIEEWDKCFDTGGGCRYGYQLKTITAFIQQLLNQQREEIREMVEKEFKSHCIINKDGDCKYWNRDKNNESYADDRFFPQELLDKIKTKLGSKPERKI